MSRQWEMPEDESPGFQVVKQPAEGPESTAQKRRLLEGNSFYSYFWNLKYNKDGCLRKSRTVHKCIHFEILHIPVINKLNKNTLTGVKKYFCMNVFVSV